MAEQSGNINIYARLRKIMPWEDNALSATAVDNHRILNRSSKRQQAYDFTKVFTPSDDNHKCFNDIGAPMLENVLKGYNAILMAYGQTGSGKTYSILGKINKSVKGLLTLSLENLIEEPNVSYLELSAVETFGHHIQKIRLFDLGDPSNQIEQWDRRAPLKSSAKIKNAHKIRLNRYNIDETIKKLHSASHFAPTAKNPQSSRGHICYVTTVHLKYFKDDKNSGINSMLPKSHDLVTHWIVVDLAGSEGESALTPEFQREADPSEVMARRLEAWCINHGLSQLQMIFNELRGLKKKGLSTGSGLKKTLSEFISNRSYIAVLFTISPSQDNSKSTEATLRFAESAALVKCTPVKAEKKVNKDELIAELRKFIQDQQAMIEDKNNQIHILEKQLMETYLVESTNNTPITKTPLPKTNGKIKDRVDITHREKDDDMTHSLDFESAMGQPLTFNMDRTTTPTVNPEMRTDRSGTLELPITLVKQLNQHEHALDEEKKSESIWRATKTQRLSHQDEFELEQSLKKEMSETRRASRVSADVQFAAQILSLSNEAHPTEIDVVGLSGLITPMREHSLRSLSVMTPLDEESEDDEENVMRPCTKRRLNKILNDHRNGYQLHPQSLLGLNKKELKYLCTAFAGHQGVRDETDKIIQQHEEQIQFLTKELDRMVRYQRHSQSLSSFDQFGGKEHIRLNVMMEDIDEKFEPSMTEDKILNATGNGRGGTSKGGYDRIGMEEREDSASSTRIDPVGVTYHGHGMNGQYQSAPLKLIDSDDDERESDKTREGKEEERNDRKRCFCVVM